MLTITLTLDSKESIPVFSRVLILFPEDEITWHLWALRFPAWVAPCEIGMGRIITKREQNSIKAPFASNCGARLALCWCVGGCPIEKLRNGSKKLGERGAKGFANMMAVGDALYRPNLRRCAAHVDDGKLRVGFPDLRRDFPARSSDAFKCVNIVNDCCFIVFL